MRRPVWVVSGLASAETVLVFLHALRPTWFFAGGAALLGLLAVALLLRLAARADQVVTAVERRRDRELLFVLRQLRHRLVNDLQVVAGWLQLGEVETARTKLEHVVDELGDQGRLLHLGDPRLAAHLLKAVAAAEARGVRLKVDLPERAPEAGPWAEWLASLLSETAAAVGEAHRRHLQVQVQPAGEGIAVQVEVPGLAADEVAASLMRAGVLRGVARCDAQGERLVVRLAGRGGTVVTTRPY